MKKKINVRRKATARKISTPRHYRNDALAQARDQGAASLRVSLSRGVLTVRHGDSGEVLIKRGVGAGFWTHALWPTLKHSHPL